MITAFDHGSLVRYTRLSSLPQPDQHPTRLKLVDPVQQEEGCLSLGGIDYFATALWPASHQFQGGTATALLATCSFVQSSSQPSRVERLTWTDRALRGWGSDRSEKENSSLSPAPPSLEAARRGWGAGRGLGPDADDGRAAELEVALQPHTPPNTSNMCARPRQTEPTLRALQSRGSHGCDAADFVESLAGQGQPQATAPILAIAEMRMSRGIRRG